MSGKSPSLKNVLSALPAIQSAIRDEIAARIDAGELIAGDEWQAKRKPGVKQSGNVARTNPRRARNVSQTAA